MVATPLTTVPFEMPYTNVAESTSAPTNVPDCTGNASLATVSTREITSGVTREGASFTAFTVTSKDVVVVAFASSVTVNVIVLVPLALGIGVKVIVRSLLDP